MSETRRAIGIIGPWTGLKVYDDDQNEIVFIDACAKKDLIALAAQCLEADAIVWSKDGQDYKMQAGVSFALQILKAIQ